MVLLELAAQSVRGVSPAVRVPLKPGYTVLKPPGADTPLAGLISALLFADGRGGDASFIAPGQKSGKAGVTLIGNDRGTYRLIRELGGPGALHKLDPATQKFQVLSEDAAETGQYLRSQVGVPPKATFEQLFTLTVGQLPSRRPAKKTAPARPSSPGLPQAQAVEAVEDAAASQARLAGLQKELVLSREIDQLQFRLDGISSQLFDAEAKLKSTEGLRAALAEARQALQGAPDADALGLPPDIVARLEGYAQAVARRDEALAELGASEQAPAERGGVGVTPWREEVRLWGALAVGAALFIGGALLTGAARYVALLDIPAFGFAAYCAIRHIEQLQDAERAQRKGGVLDKREQKVRASFDREAGPVLAAVKALGVETPSEAAEALGKKALLAEKVEDFRQQLEVAERDPDFIAAAARQAKLKREQESINQALLEKGGGVRPAQDVEHEIARVEEALRVSRAPASAPKAAPAAGAEPAREDPVPALWVLAMDLLEVDALGVNELVKDRAGQYLLAMTDRRYQGVALGRDGGSAAVAAAGPIPAAKLPPKDLDLLFLSVRLALIEKYSARFKVPFVMEDVFGAVDEAKAPLFGRMLKHLGTSTQVLHVASGAAFDAMADAVVKL